MQIYLQAFVNGSLLAKRLNKNRLADQEVAEANAAGKREPEGEERGRGGKEGDSAISLRMCVLGQRWWWWWGGG